MIYISSFLLIISPILFACAMPDYTSQTAEQECVVLLHGLARTKYAMKKMERHLRAENYEVVNFDYPSRKFTIEDLSDKALPEAIKSCRECNPVKIHFVTHSLGGIMLRYYLQQHDIPDLGRVVMLSPPNKGSEVVDKLRNIFLFKFLNGPAGQQLGTDPSSMPNTLGKVDFDLVVITGNRSINWINSILIPGSDDGKVSVERARVEGMSAFLVAHTSHPYIMKNSKVIDQTIHFIKNGKFLRKEQ